MGWLYLTTVTSRFIMTYLCALDLLRVPKLLYAISMNGNLVISRFDPLPGAARMAITSNDGCLCTTAHTHGRMRSKVDHVHMKKLKLWKFFVWPTEPLEAEVKIWAKLVHFKRELNELEVWMEKIDKNMFEKFSFLSYILSISCFKLQELKDFVQTFTVANKLKGGFYSLLIMGHPNAQFAHYPGLIFPIR